MDIKKITGGTWKETGIGLSKAIFWIAVVVGGIWLLDVYFNQVQQNNENELYSKLQEVCGVITNEQPDNMALYDACMDKGNEVFAPPGD